MEKIKCPVLIDFTTKAKDTIESYKSKFDVLNLSKFDNCVQL